MSDPRRWLGPDSDAPPGARELLTAASRPEKLPAQVDRRTSSRVARLAAVPAGVFTALLTVKIVAVAATVTVVTAGAAIGVPWIVKARRDARTARERAAAIVPPSETPPPMTEPPRPEPVSQPVPSRPRPRAPAPAKAQPVDAAFAREVALLEQARTELTRSPRRTLAILRRYDAKFRHGQLELEREVIALDALRRLGRRAEVRRNAASLLARHPASPYRARIEEILQRLDEPSRRDRSSR